MRPHPSSVMMLFNCFLLAVNGQKPHSLSFEFWGRRTDTFAEIGMNGTIKRFSTTRVQAWDYAQGWYSSSTADDDGKNRTTTVKANNLSDREAGSYTIVAKGFILKTCAICPSDINVDAYDTVGPDYYASTLTAKGETALPGCEAGCEIWSHPNGIAGLNHTFHVLPKADGSALLIQEDRISAGYNQTIRFDYFWTDAPAPLFAEVQAQWDEIEKEHGPCVDKRTSRYGCMF